MNFSLPVSLLLSFVLHSWSYRQKRQCVSESNFTNALWSDFRSPTHTHTHTHTQTDSQITTQTVKRTHTHTQFISIPTALTWISRCFISNITNLSFLRLSFLIIFLAFAEILHVLHAWHTHTHTHTQRTHRHTHTHTQKDNKINI